MVPKNMIDVKNGLTPQVLEAMPKLLDRVLGELERLDIKLKPKNSLSFSNIIERVCGMENIRVV